MNNTTKGIFTSNTGTKVDMSVDHRIYTKDGQKDIMTDFKRNQHTLQAIEDTLTMDMYKLQHIHKHIDNVQKGLTVDIKLAQLENGKYVAILDDKTRANYSIEERDEALNQLAKIYSEVYEIDIEEAKSIVTKNKKGAVYTDTENKSTIYIDDKNNNGALDTVATFKHEGAHAQKHQGKLAHIADEDMEAHAKNMESYSVDGLEFTSLNYNDVTLDNSVPPERASYTQADIELLNSNTQEYKDDKYKAELGEGKMDYSEARPAYNDPFSDTQHEDFKDQMYERAYLLIDDPRVKGTRIGNKLKNLLRRHSNLLYVRNPYRRAGDENGNQVDALFYGTSNPETGKVRITSLSWNPLYRSEATIQQKLDFVILHEVKHLIVGRGHPGGYAIFDQEIKDMGFWVPNR